MKQLTEKTGIVRRVCAALAADDRALAADIARNSYPFAPVTAGKRAFSAFQATSVFRRDGFIDRYSGTELVFPGALRLLSRLLPAEFPAHPNWKASESHIVYYELFPTIDHVVPIALGGENNRGNWVTTSMVHNSAKANFTLDVMGWTVLPPGDLVKWDGMTKWFVDFVARAPEHLADPYIKTWLAAAKRASTAD